MNATVLQHRSNTPGDVLRASSEQITKAIGLTATEARLEARLLAAHALNVNRAWLIAHDGDALSGEQMDAVEALIQRRLNGEPIAYILGEREFYSRAFKVTPATLIPRPETEHLVEAALSRLHAGGTNAEILDIGTGSGCIAITLKLESPDTRVTAVDISPEALAVARENAQHLQAEVTFLQSDLFSALDEGRKFDLIVSNPPYIAAADAHLEQGDLRFEPATALASGESGLDAIRAIIEKAPAHLQPGGWLLLEHGWDQAEAVAALLTTAGFNEIFMQPDLAGQPRISGGRYGKAPRL